MKKKKQVPNFYLDKFKDYDWYYNEVENINEVLKTLKTNGSNKNNFLFIYFLFLFTNTGK